MNLSSANIKELVEGDREITKCYDELLGKSNSGPIGIDTYKCVFDADGNVVLALEEKYRVHKGHPASGF